MRLPYSPRRPRLFSKTDIFRQMAEPMPLPTACGTTFFVFYVSAVASSPAPAKLFSLNEPASSSAAKCRPMTSL